MNILQTSNYENTVVWSYIYEWQSRNHTENLEKKTFFIMFTKYNILHIL